MLASLIAAFASGEAMKIVHRAKVTAIAYALAGLCGLCGLGFLVGAGYIAASRRYGSLEAAIGFGVGFIVIALLILAIRAIAARSRARRARRRGVDLAAIAGVAAMSVLPDAFEKPGRDHRADRGARRLCHLSRESGQEA